LHAEQTERKGFRTEIEDYHLKGEKEISSCDPLIEGGESDRRKRLAREH